MSLFQASLYSARSAGDSRNAAPTCLSLSWTMTICTTRLSSAVPGRCLPWDPHSGRKRIEGALGLLHFYRVIEEKIFEEGALFYYDFCFCACCSTIDGFHDL
ncbi:unnamed protein product, partial [Sphacelaria rigidula]